MGAQYEPVIWNRNKIIYDVFLFAGILAYILIYLKVAPMYQDVSRPIDVHTLRMKAFGSCAFIMLTFVLMIGPLARLDRRFLPVLYNRRHVGVMTCAIAGAHAMFALFWYFSFSPVDPYVALLSANTSYEQIVGFPFEVFGIAALVILIVLAATSHDFWLKFLSPPGWKALHMSVYAAYFLVVLHVGLGALQDVKNPVFPAIVGVSVIAVSILHVLAALKEWRTRPQRGQAAADASWVVAGRIGDIAENKAITVALAGGEEVAVFRYDGKLSAVTNACAHQNGPLGEGRIVDGCVTCPWHGFQYLAADGRAPAPFTERIATYNLKLQGDLVLVNPNANPPGTFVAPLAIGDTSS